VQPALERMLARAAIADADAGRFWRLFDLLTHESLDFTRSDTARRFSGICRDGTPWQFCTVLGSGSAPIRFLTEVGSPTSPLRERTALTLARMPEVFDLVGGRDPYKTVDVLADLVPPNDDYLAAFWLGLAIGTQGRSRLRLYANNGWGDETERWLRLIRALRALNAGGFGAALQPLLPLLLQTFSPSGFAITVPGHPLLCKLYLRPIAPPWSAVRTLAQSVLASHAEDFIVGIEDALEQPIETIPRRALVVSVAGSAAGGTLDLKLDFCGHCLFENAERASRVVAQLGQSFGLSLAPYGAAVEDLGGAGLRLPNGMVAFIGVGGTARGNDRVNVYLTPPTRGQPERP
jgi:hypothetical protein